MTDTTTELPITATELLELRTLAMRLQTDLSRFGDRWNLRRFKEGGALLSEAMIIG